MTAIIIDNITALFLIGKNTCLLGFWGFGVNVKKNKFLKYFFMRVFSGKFLQNFEWVGQKVVGILFFGKG